MKVGKEVVTVVLLASILTTIVVSAMVSASDVLSSSTVRIEDAEIDSIGSTTEVNIYLDGAPEGLSGYNMTIYLEDPDVAEIVSVEFPEWATLKDNSTLPADSFWMKAVDLNDNVKKGASNISLGKIVIRGDKQGETKINATISKMDDDEGGMITPSINTGSLVIARSEVLIPTSVEVLAGKSVKLNLTLDEAPSGLSEYNITISLTNTSIADIVSVEFPEWATMTDNSTLPADSFWMKVNDTANAIVSGDKNVSLGSFEIRGDTGGVGEIIVTVTYMVNDEGHTVPLLQDTMYCELNVISVKVIPGQSNPPTDPDGDGLYEDTNGNGRKDFNDVVVFFDHLEWIEDNEPTQCFDFNENGRIDFDDVVSLFKEM